MSKNLPPGAMAFVVLREPCERFASAYDELRGQLTGQHGMPHSDEAYLRIANGTQGVLQWANLLLNGKGSLGAMDMIIRNKKGLFRQDLEQESYIHMWKQQTWVAPQRTSCACLPTLRSDIDAILARYAPGCQMPAHSRQDNVHYHPLELTANQSHVGAPHPSAWSLSSLGSRTAARPTPELCRMVDALYPEDVALWKSQCAGRETAKGSAGAPHRTVV